MQAVLPVWEECLPTHARHIPDLLVDQPQDPCEEQVWLASQASTCGESQNVF